jgi:hypothetical protein
MSKFLSRIDKELSVIAEAPEDEVGELTPPGGDPAAEPVETPVSALPDEMEGEDDTSKLQMDYVEMIRKALIMAPKHIDDVDYARLTKITDPTNFEEMKELVSRIVRNNYPHPDFEV